MKNYFTTNNKDFEKNNNKYFRILFDIIIELLLFLLGLLNN